MKRVSKKLKNIMVILPNNLFILGIVWKKAKLRFIIKIVFTIVTSVLPTLNILVIRYIISLLESDIDRTETLLWKILIIILGLMSIQFVSRIFFAFNSALIEPVLASNINNYMNEIFFDKAKIFEYKNFEDSVFYDKYTRALAQVESLPHVVFNSLFQLFGNLISIISLSALILSMDSLVIIFVLFMVSVNFIQSIITSKLNFNTSQELTPISRKQNYIKRILYEVNYAKEIKTNDVIDTGKRYYFESFQKLLATLKKYGFKIVWISVISVFLTLIASASMMVYLFYKVWFKIYTIAEYSALMNSASQFESSLKSFFENISSLYKNSLEIDNLKFVYFYKRENSDGCLTLDSKQPYTVEVKNLYFKYPNSDKYALNNISFKINPGEKVSLVGLNGSGKTTLIKLMLGLYEPCKGEILINGVNLKKFRSEEIYKKIGTVFQDHQIFAYTIKENISFENDMNISIDRILEELDMIPVINKLSKKMETPLSKEFDNDGTFLSGGEAQKICIARALNKDVGLYIFDEPSSALDPVSEYKMNKLLYEITDKTVIFISHRLTTAVMADNILVLNMGKLLEQGTHKELMKKKGFYFNLFSKQAEQYSTNIQ